MQGPSLPASFFNIFKCHTDLTDHTDFLMSRRNKRNKRNYLNSILSDDTFMFYLRHSENSFSRCFRQNINLCSQEQSSLSKRLSSDRILPLLIRVNSWLIRGNSCSKIKISVKICEICVPLIFPLFLLFLRDKKKEAGWVQREANNDRNTKYL